jgi:hypothetical protein
MACDLPNRRPGRQVQSSRRSEPLPRRSERSLSRRRDRIRRSRDLIVTLPRGHPATPSLLCKITRTSSGRTEHTSHRPTLLSGHAENESPAVETLPRPAETSPHRAEIPPGPAECLPQHAWRSLRGASLSGSRAAPPTPGSLVPHREAQLPRAKAAWTITPLGNESETRVSRRTGVTKARRVLPSGP